MARLQTLAVVLIAVCAFAAPTMAGSAAFDAHFADETLRVDYFHTGNAQEEMISLDQMWRQGIWAGSRTPLVGVFQGVGYASEGLYGE